MELVEPNPSVRTPSIHQSSKKNPSVKESSKAGYPNLEDVSESRDYEVKINAVNSFHGSRVEPQSDKQDSRIEELKSQKQSVKQSEKMSHKESEKGSAVAQ